MQSDAGWDAGADNQADAGGDVQSDAGWDAGADNQADAGADQLPDGSADAAADSSVNIEGGCSCRSTGAAGRLWLWLFMLFSLGCFRRQCRSNQCRQ